MRLLLGFARKIDRLNDAVFSVIRWLTLIMIAVGAYNAIARYVTRATGINLASNAYFDIQWYLFSLIFLLGAAYGLNHGVHVRVDVLFAKLSARGRAWIDLVGTVCFVIPFAITMLVTAWPAVRNSWSVREASPDPGGLARYPIKTVILVCFSLLLLQAIAQVIKQVAGLRGLTPLEPAQQAVTNPHPAPSVP